MESASPTDVGHTLASRPSRPINNKVDFGGRHANMPSGRYLLIRTFIYLLSQLYSSLTVPHQ
jgi:hypothetical protein